MSLGEVGTSSAENVTPPGMGARAREIAGIALVAVSVLALVSLFSEATGLIGMYVAAGLRWFAGQAAWMPPILTFGAGIICFRGKWDASVLRKAAGCLLACAVGLVMLHLAWRWPLLPADWAWDREMAVGARGVGGGVAGSVMAAALMVSFGLAGTAVVLGAGLLIAVVVVFDVSISALVAAVFKGVTTLITGVIRWLVQAAYVGAEEAWVGIRRRRDRRLNRETFASPAGDEGYSLPGESFADPFPGRGRAMEPLGDVRDVPLAVPGDAPGSQGRSASREVAASAEVAPEPDYGQGSGQVALTAPAAGRPAPSRSEEESRQSSSHEPLLRLRDLATADRMRVPPPSLLELPRPSRRRLRPPEPDRSERLVETLASFGIEAKVVNVSQGPAITRYEIQPAPGIKVSRIVSLADDLALALAAAGVRIEAPVPGKAVVGIEVPNQHVSPVYLREILESEAFLNATSPLTVALGKDIAGSPVVADLRKLLHLLIAGATGSGKSVCLNAMIVSMLYRARPHEVKFIMIDPKRVELAVYDGIPHLVAPVVTDPRKAPGVLRWVVKEMERRYQLCSEIGVRNVDSYNAAIARRGHPDAEVLPYLVVIIDELADLMMVSAAEVEDSICRLAQMARAAGIYLIIATQRPSVDVITGLIKANIPSRISFAVSSQVDSRTILDMAGAERLLGKGDMLFYPIGSPKPQRVQGAFIDDEEVEAVVAFWKRQGRPQYREDVLEEQEKAGSSGLGDVDDELFEDAVRLVQEQGHASVSLIQRRFRIGYSRAARLIDMMEARGIVGPYQGSKPREVLITSYRNRDE